MKTDNSDQNFHAGTRSLRSLQGEHKEREHSARGTGQRRRAGWRRTWYKTWHRRPAGFHNSRKMQP